MSKWTLKEATELIAAQQPTAKEHGYHICLGGGVLNKGESEKDLDLYFLPMENHGIVQSQIELIMWLTSLYGAGIQINGNMKAKLTNDPRHFGRLTANNTNNPNPTLSDYPINTGLPTSAYKHKIMFMLGQRRIDVFIL